MLHLLLKLARVTSSTQATLAPDGRRIRKEQRRAYACASACNIAAAGTSLLCSATAPRPERDTRGQAPAAPALVSLVGPATCVLARSQSGSSGTSAAPKYAQSLCIANTSH